MKRLTIIFAFALIPFLSKGQAYENAYGITRFWNPIGISTRGTLLFDTSHYALQVGYNGLNKGMILPIATTSLVPVQGGFFYSPVDSSIYYSNGFNWTKVGSGGLTPSDLHDSLAANALEVRFPLVINTTDTTLSADTTEKDSSLVNYRQMKQYVGQSGSGVTSFNSRTGSVIPQVADYSTFYQPLENQRLSTSNSPQFDALNINNYGSAFVSIKNNTAALDSKTWQSYTNGDGNLYFRTANDAGNATTNWLIAGRSGNTIPTVTFPSSNVLISKNLVDSGTITLANIKNNATLDSSLVADQNGVIKQKYFFDNNLANSNLVQTNSVTRGYNLNGGTLIINDTFTRPYNSEIINNMFGISNNDFNVNVGTGLYGSSINANYDVPSNPSVSQKIVSLGAPNNYVLSATLDTLGFHVDNTLTGTQLARIYPNGSLSVNNYIIASSASITNNIAASGVVSNSFLNANGTVNYHYKVITANYTIAATDLVIIDTANTAVTVTMTDGTGFNSGMIVIIKNKGTASITLTNMASGEATAVAAGATSKLINTNFGWVKIN